MTSQRISQVFKMVGKYVAMMNIMTGQKGAYDLVSFNLDSLFTTGPASPLDAYGEMMMGVVGVIDQVVQVSGFINQIQDLSQQAITNYLNFLAPELGLATNATITSVLQTLANQMTTNSLTILHNGQYASYFALQYDFRSFPAAESPNILESWITSDLV